VLYVWIALVVVAVVVLGSVAFSLLGALQRLRREVAGLEEAVRPLVVQAQAVQAARAAGAAGAGAEDDTPAPVVPAAGPLPADAQVGSWQTSG
jgi:type II secretory pathway pseudopilin PulG